jgi:O-acetyl-ADP-ribose deacetylase (regulator of RNase III)
MKVRVGVCRLELVQGDITRQQVDAVVNAANSQLLGGGGVDGAIHRAAGPTVMRELQQRFPLGCPTGDAVVTEAGELPAKWIFHAVGPIWRGGLEQEPQHLRSAYRRCLELAETQQCQSIAFPSLSTGAYGYPVDLASEAALDEICRRMLALEKELRVRFVLFDAGTLAAYARSLEALLPRLPAP